MLRFSAQARELLVAATEVARLREVPTCGRLDVAVAALLLRYRDPTSGHASRTDASMPALSMDEALQELINAVGPGQELTAQQLIDDLAHDPAAQAVLHG